MQEFKYLDSVMIDDRMCERNLNAQRIKKISFGQVFKDRNIRYLFKSGINDIFVSPAYKFK